MKSDFLLPLTTLLYFASPILCQQQSTTNNRATYYSTRRSVTATTKVVSIPPVTISGKVVSETYSGEILPLPTGQTSTQSATATPTRSREQLKKLILDALKNVPDIERFTAWVNAESNIFELLNPESNYPILAPNNDAVKANIGGNRRRDGSYPPELALSFVQRGFGDPPLSAGPRTLKTSLKDPKYVNLGPDEPARLVSLPVGTNLSIVAGMGESVSFGADIPFEAGTINVGKNTFTLPQDLSTTLRGTNSTKFEKFLNSSSQLETLSNTGRMTIFALTDAAVASVGSRLTTDALGQHVIQGFPGFSPDFIVGQVYDTASRGKIKVTIAGDDYFVNGVKIVKVNAIMTNGVVHYVEDIIGPYTGPLPSSSASPSSASTTHSIAGRSSISASIALLAMVAALTRYWLMA